MAHQSASADGGRVHGTTSLPGDYDGDGKTDIAVFLPVDSPVPLPVVQDRPSRSPLFDGVLGPAGPAAFPVPSTWPTRLSFMSSAVTDGVELV